MPEEETRTVNIKVEKLTEYKYRSEAKGPKHHIGVLPENGDWINVNCFSKEDLLKVIEGVEIGKAYKVTLEGKYDNVKSFERMPTAEEAGDPYPDKTDQQLAEDAPKTQKKSSFQFLTPAEFVFRDMKIVRQSCLKAAAEANPKGIPYEELTNYAAELEKWVYR